MSIRVNGQHADPPQPRTLAALIATLAPRAPFATAVNGDFVSKVAYTEYQLKDGDLIEIVYPSAGG